VPLAPSSPRADSLPNYYAVLLDLDPVRNGVIIAKHAFNWSHRTFRTSFADVPKPHYLLF
jgi:hypothetical protein